MLNNLVHVHHIHLYLIVDHGLTRRVVMHFIIYLMISFLVCQRDLSCADSNNFNPYDVLGLSRTASDKDIRQAYKKLARHWHPDKNSESNAHDQFTKINAAYEVNIHCRNHPMNCLFFLFDM
jgi:preprotein translocase subunit Sec63